MAAATFKNDFLLRIRSVYPSMTKAEKRIADFILKNAKAVRFMSISDLARACDVGLTSVFRFCKSLELGGYHEFKVQLSASLNEADEERAASLKQPAKNNVVNNMAQELLSAHINALQESFAMIDSDMLGYAANFISASNQIRFFGTGGSMLTAMDGMYKFMHLLPNVTCLPDLHMQLTSISTMNEHDTAIFISHSGENRELVQMAEKARIAGAKTVSITRYSKSSLALVSEVVLLCGGYELPLQEGSFPTKSAQMYVLELLFNEVSSRKQKLAKGGRTQV